MNLKLPLKAKGNFFGMKESYTEIEDANGTIFRVSAPHDSTVNTQKTVQFIVSAVNNYEAMQAVLDDCALLAHRVKMQCYSCECYEEGDCHTDCVSDYARKIYDDLSALRKPKKTSSEIDPKVFAMTEEDKRKITDLMDWVERSGKSYYVFKSALKELKGD